MDGGGGGDERGAGRDAVKEGMRVGKKGGGESVV